MKFQYLFLLVLVVLCATDTLAAEKRRKRKKVVHNTPPTESEDMIKMMEKDDEETAHPETDDGVIDNRLPFTDPCAKVHCGAGRVCEVDEDEEPNCVCISTCPVETEARRKVCSNHNETWTSDCAVYQQRCWCDKADERCKGEPYKHVHIEYYGECREMPECKEDEMADFPRRMRDWLFNVMRDLADRKELSPRYLEMEKEAEANLTRRWTNAAIWKWCDLDGHPHDRSVSRHELFPIRAPLMTLEHCIAPFLNNCDSDNNHRITLKEWANCLELEEDEIEDRCDDIADQNE